MGDSKTSQICQCQSQKKTSHTLHKLTGESLIMRFPFPSASSVAKTWLFAEYQLNAEAFRICEKHYETDLNGTTRDAGFVIDHVLTISFLRLQICWWCQSQHEVKGQIPHNSAGALQRASPRGHQCMDWMQSGTKMRLVHCKRPHIPLQAWCSCQGECVSSLSW